MPFPTLLLQRRTALYAAPLFALSSCTWGPSTDPVTSEEIDHPPLPDDDEQVSVAIDAIRTAGATLAAVSEAHPGLADRLDPLVALHTGHLELLDASVAMAPPVPQILAQPAAAWKQVLTAEQTLQTALTSLAGEVISGQLARVLAAMAAGIVQHVTALPAAPKAST